jgi:hypothetical protein
LFSQGLKGFPSKKSKKTNKTILDQVFNFFICAILSIVFGHKNLSGSDQDQDFNENGSINIRTPLKFHFKESLNNSATGA